MSENTHASVQGDKAISSNPTDMTSISFETAWRELRPRTINMLLRRGASRDVAEDIAQETAIRLLKNWHLVDGDRPIWPFVRRIAINCLVDRHRRTRHESLDQVPDRESVHDVEEQGLARFRLSEVWRAMGGLSHKERSILLAEVGVVTGFGNTSATKMARHRARQKLTAAMGRSGAFGGIPVTWRRLTAWMQLHVPTTHIDVATSAGLLVIVSAAAVSLTPPAHPSPNRPPAAIRPAEVSHVSDMKRTAATRPTTTAARSHPQPKRSPLSLDPTPQPSPSGSSDPEKSVTTAQAGPARAETGQDGGATYVQLCTGENTPTTADDTDTTIVLYDGDQEENDGPPECRHEEQEESP